jgi:cell division protein FtsB
MIKKSQLKAIKFTKKAAFNIMILLMLLYFVFHSIYGSRGVIAYFKLQAELESAHNKLNMLRAERLEIENKAKLLRPGSLDIDMLDEKARNILGIVSPNEQVFRKEILEHKED